MPRQNVKGGDAQVPAPRNNAGSPKLDAARENSPAARRSQVSATEPRAGATDVTLPAEIRHEWKEKIANAWRASIEAVIETGRLLVAAKKALPHGEFTIMIEKELPFGGRTAQRLMRIANDRRLIDATRVSLLPNHWGTLYELTRLDDSTFALALERGVIRPDMERDDAVALRQPPRSRTDKASAPEPVVPEPVPSPATPPPTELAGLEIQGEMVDPAEKEVLGLLSAWDGFMQLWESASAEIKEQFKELRGFQLKALRIPIKRERPSQSRQARWSDAVEELLAVREEYEQWLESMPENLRDSPTGQALQDIVNLDLGELESIEPPLGFGRD